MTKKEALELIERHVEKALLGLAVIFMLAVAVRYLGMEPNKVEYGGRKLDPGQLDEEIQRRAEDLQRAVRSATPSRKDVPAYAQQLRRAFEEGLFGKDTDGGPPLLPALTTVAEFRPPLPELEEGLEPDNVALVKPLKPTSVVAQTGISLVYPQQTTLAATETQEPSTTRPAEEQGPTETSWVTVAAYFPLEAQRQAMVKAGYAGYRAKVHVVGLDVQRQELTASGEFSDWVDVKPSKAMPKIELPAPVYDEKTGELTNQAQLDQALNLVRTYQQWLMQPPFYPVDGGDEWSIPPLPGHEPKPEVEEEKEKDKEREKKAEESKRKPEEQPKAPPPPRGMYPPVPGPRGALGPAPTAGRGSRMAAGPSPAAAPQQAGPLPENPRKKISDDLREARKAMRNKDYQQARQLAESVANNPEANSSQQRQARSLLQEAEKAIQRQSGVEARSVARVPTQLVLQELVKNPADSGEVAVWFHDDSVQPGKTYRYRMRVKLWNRYVGRRASLREPQQADLTVLAGEWSEPSPPITVAPKQRFFVRGRAHGEDAALVDVFTWYKGNWLKEDFKVSVGDAIGGVREVRTGQYDREEEKARREKVDFFTGAIVLDLRLDEPALVRRSAGKQGEFAYTERRSLVLVYLDTTDGQVKERIDDVDRADPTYKRLKDEWDEFKETL